MSDLEFEIELSRGPTPGMYAVKVIQAASGGEPIEAVHLDVDQYLARRNALEDNILASAARARRVAPVSEQPLRHIGHELFAAVFAGRVGGAYRQSEAIAYERGTQLRVVFRLAAPELSQLPWEALYDKERDTYLCRKEPLIRHVPTHYTPDPLPVQPPLRILGLIATPRDLAPLDAAAEQRRLETALEQPLAEGRVVIDWVPRASWDAVHGRMLNGQWHVIHFIGHGEYDPAREEGRLALVGHDDRADWVEASRLADLLGEANPVPRLVVLNACASGQSAVSDSGSAVGATLVARGVSAAVAMQFSVTDWAAIAFPSGLYASLASGRTVEEAVRSGRIAILGNANSLEWVTPVLYVRGRANRLFDFTAGPWTPPGHAWSAPPATFMLARNPDPAPPLSSGSAPPTGHRPRSMRNLLVLAGAVAALGLGGGIVVALSSDGGQDPSSRRSQSSVVGSSHASSPPDTPTTTTTVSTGGSSGDAFAAFAARANTICSTFKPTLEGEFNSGSAALLQDTKDLTKTLTNLGPSPSSDSSWRLGLEDWQQAVSFLSGGGDRQDWLINIWAGADEFRDMGISACASLHSIGE